MIVDGLSSTFLFIGKSELLQGEKQMVFQLDLFFWPEIFRKLRVCILVTVPFLGMTRPDLTSDG